MTGPRFFIIRCCLSRVPLMAALTVAACAESTAPTPADEQTIYDVEVRILSIDSRFVPTYGFPHCEEAFTHYDGGEFIWSFEVVWPDGRTAVIQQTADYPDVDGYVQVTSEVPVAVSGSAYAAAPGDANSDITVRLRAAEIDFDVFGGNPGMDSRMADVSHSVRHPVRSYDDEGFTIEVATSECGLTAAYRIAATPRP